MISSYVKKQHFRHLSYKYTKIKINSNDDLPLEKTLNMQNLLIRIKFVFNKNHKHCYSETFVENCSYK